MAEHALDGLLQMLEVPGARIRLVPQEVPRALRLTHRVHGFRAHIERDPVWRQVDDIELRTREVRLALLRRVEGQQAYRVYLVRFVAHAQSNGFCRK